MTTTASGAPTGTIDVGAIRKPTRPGSTGPSSPRTSGRITALDGVRGVAAFIVVVYHCLLVARPFLETDAPLVWAWIEQSPLHLLVAGPQAVLVFFVLSGLVVALPAFKDGFSWPSFMASRFLRLYVPVWGALLFSATLVLLVPRNWWMVTQGSWMDGGNVAGLDIPKLFAEATLAPATYDYDNVLWSLRWEVIFSLTLPAFIAIALLVRRHAVAAVAIAAAASMLGRVVDADWLMFLPVFLIGTIIATRLDDLRDWAARHPNPWLWRGGFALSLVLLIANYLALPVVPGGSVAGDALWGLATAGATLLIVTVIGWPTAQQAMQSRGVQWLGTVSFSLYLVHLPIIATLAYALGDWNWLVVGVLAVPLSLIVASLFHTFVEVPSHGLARRVGKSVAAREHLRFRTRR